MTGELRVIIIIISSNIIIIIIIIIITIITVAIANAPKVFFYIDRFIATATVTVVYMVDKFVKPS